MNRTDENPLKLSAIAQSTTGSIITKIIAIIVGGTLLISALVISIAFFAVAFVVAAIAFGYFWWKTRAIRRQVREHLEAEARWPHDVAPAGDVIEGVVVARTERTEQSSRTHQHRVDDRPASTRGP